MRSWTSRFPTTWCRYKHLYSRCVDREFGCSIHAQNIRVLNVEQKRWVTGTQSTLSSKPTSWERPEGYDTQILVFNPLVKEKVPLILRHENFAQWYACGPTVYDSAHIGHASSYIRLDIMRRILQSVFNIDIFLVMGVTDIDDKIINKTKETGQSLQDLTRFYEAEFFTSLGRLNVLPPSVVVRVTEHISQVIDFIAGLEHRGVTYTTYDGSVLFDVNKYGRYGAFVHTQPQSNDTTDSQKRSPQDFALWKACKPGEPFWDSPWGKGRPGWHIECSAMASKMFGANFDIHTGGEDLAFPHHENELAQSCAYHGNSQWVNYWIHTGHLFQSGQSDKMSKSLKNVITVSEFLDEYTPNQFRMLCLLSSYRNRIEFSPDRMQKAMAVLTTFKSLITRCEAYVKSQVDCGPIPEAEVYEKLHLTRQVVKEALSDDFNTPKALAHLMRLVKFLNQLLGEEASEDQTITNVRSNGPVAAVGIFMKNFLEQLGLHLESSKAAQDDTSHIQFHNAVETLVSARSKLRDFAKDKHFFLKATEEAGISGVEASKLMKKLYSPVWDISDKIRGDLLNTTGVQINDDSGASTWNVVDSRKSSVPDSKQEKE